MLKISMHTLILVFFSFCFRQDGKTAEDLAYADQHELVVSLLGKLKKVKLTHTTHTVKIPSLFGTLHSVTLISWRFIPSITIILLHQP